MSDTQQAVPKGAPVWRAWENYRSTDDYANSRRWALKEEHVDGSMWAAFYAGFFACAVDATHPTSHPLEEYHEDIGPVLWWRFPVDEPPYVGSPLDTAWPGYHTHFTPIFIPEEK